MGGGAVDIPSWVAPGCTAVAWVDAVCSVAPPHCRATQLTPQGRPKNFIAFSSRCNIASFYIPLPPPPLVSFPAIYNYDARGEEELSLQIGDTVHILEKYEGELGLGPHNWTSVPLGPLLRQLVILDIWLVGSSWSLTYSFLFRLVQRL